ncbi:helix-turn-helix domain-containing protein [Endothiovibrio diazotrophicus]
MQHVTKAEELFAAMRAMPAGERSRFFALLGAQLFQDEELSQEQLFGHLKDQPFTTQEAAEYLEVSVATLRRYVKAGRIEPSQVIGRSQLFSTGELKAFKKTLGRK